MKHLYYVRHGESENNAAGRWSGQHNTPLTAKGHEQAKQAAAKAKAQGLSFDLIISSPLSRAHTTAKYIAQSVGYPIEDIVQHKGFIERGFGILENTQHAEAAAKYRESEALIDDYEGVERLVDTQWRAQQMLDYLLSLPHDTILVVGHGSFARSLRRAINKDPLHERGKRLENADIVKLI